jgi:hypothetical protein
MIEKKCPTCQWDKDRRVKLCEYCRKAGVPEPVPVLLALLLFACTPAPLAVRPAPPIPLRDREVYVCRAGDVSVRIVSREPPESFRVDLPGGATAVGSCILSPLGG